MAVKCTNCGGSHPKWDCKKPPKESTAARNDVHGGSDVIRSSERSVERLGITSKANPTTNKGIAGTQALPLDTLPKPKIGRPRKDGSAEPFNKKEYQREYMADLRTIKRLGLEMTVSDYRKSKET